MGTVASAGLLGSDVVPSPRFVFCFLCLPRREGITTCIFRFRTAARTRTWSALAGSSRGLPFVRGQRRVPPLASNEVHETGRKADRIESKEDVQDPAESVVAVLHLGFPKARSARSAECPMCSCLKKQICSISSQ